MFGCHIGVLGPGVRAVPVGRLNSRLPAWIRERRTWDRYGSTAHSDGGDRTALHIGEKATGRDRVLLALCEHIDGLLLQVRRYGRC